MKLYRIETNSPVHARKYSKTHWILERDYFVKLVTDEGTITCSMKAGWITDFRSGSSAVDCIVPKRGNDRYTASVLCHDLMYSGWLSKDLADELLYQGMVLSGQSKWRAGLAFKAVQWFGEDSWYSMVSPLPHPYELNRNVEHLEWIA